MGNRQTGRPGSDQPQVKALVFEGEAFAEYRDAAMHYAADNPDVALRFIDCVEAVIERIHREPHV